MSDAAITCVTLAAALVLFAGGWWRYDVVALLALLALALTGVVPAREAFLGFGHPAVVTVAAILVVSRALQDAGVVDWLLRPLAGLGRRPGAQVIALCGLGAGLSAFMNNVGALALLMPAALAMARESGRSPARLLMPLAFATLLGGLVTLIGTPPNVIIASVRAEHGAPAFGMFDFTPVGAAVALAGVVFVALIGHRLVPERRPAGGSDALFSIGEYLTELRVEAGAKIEGRLLAELEQLSDVEAIVVALLRGERRIASPAGALELERGDVLLVEVAPESLQRLCADTGLALAGGDRRHALPENAEVAIVEAVVRPDSLLVGRTAGQLRLRGRFGANLLGVAREGRRVRTRLRDLALRAGDVLMLQGPSETLAEWLASLGCLPLAERSLGLGRGRPRRLALALALFAAAVAAAAAGAVAFPVAFTAAALALIVLRVVSLRDAYGAIDGPVLVLLGAMIPVGAALETSGGAEQIAGVLAAATRALPPAATIALLLAGSMLLSNVVNNAAAALILAPDAIEAAARAGQSPDAALMAVAIGSSCAFLTPIGHQSNTLVLGPGGYRFGDYWRMGLPLSLLVLAVAVPAIAWRWLPDGAR